MHHWVPEPDFQTEHLALLRGMLTEHATDAFGDGDLGNSLDWFFFACHEKERLADLRPQTLRLLLCAQIKVDPELFVAEDAYFVAHTMDDILMRRGVSYSHGSVDLTTFMDWLGFDNVWWRGRRKQLLMMRIKQGVRTAVPGIDSPLTQPLKIKKESDDSV